MSWGKASVPTKSPKPANIDGNDTSSNQQAVPVPWWSGLDWRPLTWIVDKVYNPRTEEIRAKAGKGKETVTGYRYYGDVAGIAGLGVASKLLAFESGNEVVWTGNYARSDVIGHPDYWEASVVTPVAKLFLSWGRPDQPQDTHLLGPLGETDATLAHPNYRNQVRATLQDYFFGENTETVPNSRVLLWRPPVPMLGNFPAQHAAGGESMLAAILELLTNPIFGGGLAMKYFQAGEWEALSTEVLGAIGGLSPSLDRAMPLRDVVKDFQAYYDGWARIENGRIRPGRFPHDGSVPAGLTELSVHDFQDHPEVRATTPSATVNDVRVNFRDKDDLLRVKPANDSDSANVKARKGHEPVSIDMPAFITRAQAAKFAAEAAATGAEGEWGGEALRVRGARAKWASGAALQPGDNFNLDLIAPEVDQVSRITKRTDPFHGSPSIDFVAERGVYPTPYVPPSDLRPDIGKITPHEITQARVLELTPDLAGTPLGLPVSFIAKRPKAEFEGAALQAANVLGFNVWYGGASGASYDVIGYMPGWGVRGTLREALANDAGDVVVKLAMDADNLDLGRIVAQSAQGQLNDSLLILIGDELFSVGAITIAALNYDLTCKRVRLGSRAAAHALAAEAWVVWRDELRVFIHKGFVEDTDRKFKLQPYTQGATIELADVDVLTYHFRDRAPEAPVVVLTTVPVAPVVGRQYNVAGTISDINGDLQTFQVNAERITGGTVDFEFTLLAGTVAPDDKALFAFKSTIVFPAAGTWRIVVRAYDDTGAFTEVSSADIVVSNGTGTFSDDGVTPDPVSAVSVAGGFNHNWLTWTNPTNTPIRYVRVYINSIAALPGAWTHVAPMNFFVHDNLGNAATRYYWLQVEAMNGRVSTIQGPFMVTTIAGIDLSHLVQGLTMVEIVNTLPSSGNYLGRYVLLSTDKKLYRWTNDVIGTGTTWWSRAVDGADIVANSIIAGALAAGAVTAFAVGANEVIALTANIKDAIITDAKIVTLTVSKLTGGTIEGHEIIIKGATGVIRSDNFVAGTSGWQIDGDGNAEFNDVNIRGKLRAGKIATEAAIFNQSDPAHEDSEGPSVAVQRNYSASNVDTSTPALVVRFWGWKTGSGYARDRFFRSDPVFEALFSGYIDHYVTLWWRHAFGDGSYGSWVYITASKQTAILAGDDAAVAIGILDDLTDQSGDDSIEFGVRGSDEFGAYYDNAKKYVRGLLVVKSFNF